MEQSPISLAGGVLIGQRIGTLIFCLWSQVSRGSTQAAFLELPRLVPRASTIALRPKKIKKQKLLRFQKAKLAARKKIRKIFVFCYLRKQSWLVVGLSLAYV